MKVKGPGRPPAPPGPDPGPGPGPDPAKADRPSAPIETKTNEREQKEKQQSQDRLMGEGRIGDDSVTAQELADMGLLVAARHLMVLLAKGRGEKRKEALTKVGDLLIALDRPETVRRLLLEMPDAGRIVDIYPLEVLSYVLDRRPDLLPGYEYGQVILNKPKLESSTFRVEEVIAVRVPLSLRMRAFALDGGGTPGYCFAPGPPGEYHLELGEAGRFSLLLRGDVRKTSLIDRVDIAVTDPPE